MSADILLIAVLSAFRSTGEVVKTRIAVQPGYNGAPARYDLGIRHLAITFSGSDWFCPDINPSFFELSNLKPCNGTSLTQSACQTFAINQTHILKDLAPRLWPGKFRIFRCQRTAVRWDRTKARKMPTSAQNPKLRLEIRVSSLKFTLPPATHSFCAEIEISPRIFPGLSRSSDLRSQGATFGPKFSFRLGCLSFHRDIFVSARKFGFLSKNSQFCTGIAGSVWKSRVPSGSLQFLRNRDFREWQLSRGYRSLQRNP
jgi:hypothetical protein